jgi:hypothetical protein
VCTATTNLGLADVEGRAPQQLQPIMTPPSDHVDK